jgi:hypothetical protein
MRTAGLMGLIYAYRDEEFITKMLVNLDNYNFFIDHTSLQITQEWKGFSASHHKLALGRTLIATVAVIVTH